MTIDNKLEIYKNCPLREKVPHEELNSLKYLCNSENKLCPMQATTSQTKYCWYDMVKLAREQKTGIANVKKYQG